MPDDKGVSLRARLEQVEEQTGNRPPDLDGPPLPEVVDHLPEIHLELRAAAGGTGFGPAPVAYAELWAWCTLTGVMLDPFEVECIMALDAAYLAARAEKGGSDGAGGRSEADLPG